MDDAQRAERGFRAVLGSHVNPYEMTVEEGIEALLVDLRLLCEESGYDFENLLT